MRDYVLAHPKFEGEYERAFVYLKGNDLEIATLFPDDLDKEAPIISIDGLDNELEAYTRDLARWVASTLQAAT